MTLSKKSDADQAIARVIDRLALLYEKAECGEREKYGISRCGVEERRQIIILVNRAGGGFFVDAVFDKMPAQKKKI